MNKQKYLIAANWKQNGDMKSATKLINDIVKLYKKNQIEPNYSGSDESSVHSSS